VQTTLLERINFGTTGMPTHLLGSIAAPTRSILINALSPLARAMQTSCTSRSGEVPSSDNASRGDNYDEENIDSQRNRACLRGVGAAACESDQYRRREPEQQPDGNCDRDPRRGWQPASERKFYVEP
jgi:hypothetical protein